MNISRIDRFVTLAKNMADVLPDNRFKHISIITTHTGKFLSSGTNEAKTHPYIKSHYKKEQIHSELAAYLSVRWYNPRRMNLINFRFNNRGELRLAKPCKFCQKWIFDVFEEVWYSNDHGEFILWNR